MFNGCKMTMFKSIYFLLWILAGSHSQEVERRYACWGSAGPPVVSAQCQRNSVIHVITAGLKVAAAGSSARCEFRSADCGCALGETGCQLGGDVRALCSGQPSCRLHVTQQYIDTGECRGFSDYMYIEFTCIQASGGQSHDVCESGSLRQRTGLLRSPAHPGPYPPDRHCQCELSVTDDKTIDIQLLELELADRDCTSDYVSLQYGEQEMMFCGQSSGLRGETIAIAERRLVLTFHSDSQRSSAGFWLQYKAAPPGLVEVECVSVYRDTGPQVPPTQLHLPTPAPQAPNETQAQRPVHQSRSHPENHTITTNTEKEAELRHSDVIEESAPVVAGTDWYRLEPSDYTDAIFQNVADFENEGNPGDGTGIPFIYDSNDFVSAERGFQAKSGILPFIEAENHAPYIKANNSSVSIESAVSNIENNERSMLNTQDQNYIEHTNEGLQPFEQYGDQHSGFQNIGQNGNQNGVQYRGQNGNQNGGVQYGGQNANQNGGVQYGGQPEELWEAMRELEPLTEEINTPGALWEQVYEDPNTDQGTYDLRQSSEGSDIEAPLGFDPERTLQRPGDGRRPMGVINIQHYRQRLAEMNHRPTHSEHLGNNLNGNNLQGNQPDFSLENNREIPMIRPTSSRRHHPLVPNNDQSHNDDTDSSIRPTGGVAINRIDHVRNGFDRFAHDMDELETDNNAYHDYIGVQEDVLQTHTDEGSLPGNRNFPQTPRRRLGRPIIRQQEPEVKTPTPSPRLVTTPWWWQYTASRDQSTNLRGDQPISSNKDQPISSNRDQPISNNRDHPTTNNMDQPISNHREQPISNHPGYPYSNENTKASNQNNAKLATDDKNNGHIMEEEYNGGDFNRNHVASGVGRGAEVRGVVLQNVEGGAAGRSGEGGGGHSSSTTEAARVDTQQPLTMVAIGAIAIIVLIIIFSIAIRWALKKREARRAWRQRQRKEVALRQHAARQSARQGARTSARLH